MGKNYRRRVRLRLKDDARDVLLHCFTLAKWIIMGVITGTVVGLVGTAFAFALEYVNAFRAENPMILFGLPAAGLLIVFLYRITRNTSDTGTNMVIESIQSSTPISYKMAPLIFISTVLTHLFGGSAGREGAALQLGGSLTNIMSDIRFLRFTENDHRVNIMCGMSAGFAALFGTPLASAVFALEVVTVGIMHYSALVPCIISSYTAYFISTGFGVRPEAFVVSVIPAFTPAKLLILSVFGLSLGAVSTIFCTGMHHTEHLYKRFFANPYARIFAAGCAVIGLTLALGTREYLGSGIGIIEHIFETGESARWYVFLLKMVFTALTLCAGFKGGEIVPSFCIGAAFGSCVSGLLGIPVPLAAACGMVGVFCGVTNCPISALLISFELFGFAGMPYYLITVAVSYMCSGYHGLYHTQKIVYSKLKREAL